MLVALNICKIPNSDRWQILFWTIENHFKIATMQLRENDFSKDEL